MGMYWELKFRPGARLADHLPSCIRTHRTATLRNKYVGGNGNDTLELTPGTYTVGIWGEGGESPIFTKGNQLMITSEFEKLIAGGTIYDFTSLTAGQIIVVG
jgi:hypothetical protein